MSDASKTDKLVQQMKSVLTGNRVNWTAVSYVEVCSTSFEMSCLQRHAHNLPDKCTVAPHLPLLLTVELPQK